MKLRGFTLIELIVVMGILAILATIVIIAVNPARQFAASRNAKRASDTRAIAQALNQHAADNNGTFYSGVTTNTKIIGTTVAANFVDLTSTLVPNYISAIPADPTGGTAADTGYVVYKSANNEIVVQAETMELGRSISTKITYAITLDGTNDYITMGNNAAFVLNTGTMEAWFKAPAQTNTNARIIEIGNGSTSQVGIFIPLNGRLNFYALDSAGSNAINITNTTSVMDNQWHHVAATWGASGTKLFLDGVEVASQGTVTTRNIAAGSVFYVGEYVGGGPYYFTGSIDEVRLSNNYRYTSNFTPARRLTEDANTIGIWHMDEGTGTTVGDNSGSARNGTLTNGPIWSNE